MLFGIFKKSWFLATAMIIKKPETKILNFCLMLNYLLTKKFMGYATKMRERKIKLHKQKS